MAIQVPYITQQGIHLPAAYLVVDAVMWTKGGEAQASGLLWANQLARQEQREPFPERFSAQFQAVLAGQGNFVQQAYAAFKLAPEFSGGIDV